MRERLVWLGWFLLGGAISLSLLGAVYQVPRVRDPLEWRFDKAEGVVRGWLYPAETLPTPVGRVGNLNPPTPLPTSTAPPTQISVEPTVQAPTPTPIPDRVSLPAPEWERQDWNNCGPATLAIGLRYYGWEGDQFDVSDLLKPDRGDKNVNVEELAYFVRTRAGWLNALYRVGGDLDLLKRLIAAGFPVMIELGFELAPTDGGGGWAGHYLLLTGYDESEQVFISQDTNPGTGGPDQPIGYHELDAEWRAFNRVYMLVYLPEQEQALLQLLGDDADPDVNRDRALESARAEIEANPEDAYAWFNLGSNLVYFERYAQAGDAFDTALSLGLPWRFTRYQFGPYIAYLNTGRAEDVIQLADATLYRTSKAEESLLWRGWAHYQRGEIAAAEADFRAALVVNPNYLDAQYALDFLRGDA